VRRQHGVTVLAGLCLARPGYHPLAVDVGDLERDHLRGAQAGALGYAQRRLVLEPGCRIEQPRHFLGAQHPRQLARLMNEMSVLDDIVTPERDPEKEPQGRYGLIEGRHANAACRQMSW
jgi:hypothetical protein